MTMTTIKYKDHKEAMDGINIHAQKITSVTRSTADLITKEKLFLMAHLCSQFGVNVEDDKKNGRIMFYTRRQFLGATLEAAIPIYYESICDLEISEIKDVLSSSLPAMIKNINAQFAELVERVQRH